MCLDPNDEQNVSSVDEAGRIVAHFEVKSRDPYGRPEATPEFVSRCLAGI